MFNCNESVHFGNKLPETPTQNSADEFFTGYNVTFSRSRSIIDMEMNICRFQRS